MKKALVMLATAVAMSGAFAQTSAPASAPMATPASAPAAKAGHERNVEDRIAYLHTQLKITSAQESQWNTFADVMRNNGETMGQLFQQRKANTNLSALDDMKQYATIAQAHADGMKKLADVTFHQGGPEGGHRHHGKGDAKKAPAAAE